MTNKDTHQLYAKTLDVQARLYAPESREILTSLTEFTNAKDVLEVGCGGGAQFEVFKDLLRDKNYLGVDISKELLAHATSRVAQSDDVTFLQKDVMDFSPSTSFDFILSFAVLQHCQM